KSRRPEKGDRLLFGLPCSVQWSSKKVACPLFQGAGRQSGTVLTVPLGSVQLTRLQPSPEGQSLEDEQMAPHVPAPGGTAGGTHSPSAQGNSVPTPGEQGASTAAPPSRGWSQRATGPIAALSKSVQTNPSAAQSASEEQPVA